jgi:hypothetical protein
LNETGGLAASIGIPRVLTICIQASYPLVTLESAPYGKFKPAINIGSIAKGSQLHGCTFLSGMGPNVNHHSKISPLQAEGQGSKSLLTLNEPKNVQCKTQVA